MTAHDVLHTLESWHEEFTRIRRTIHAWPELAFEEVRTADTVANFLQSWGIDTHRGLGITGVVGRITGRGAGGSIGLRADMDALPMTEANTFAHASRNPGVMHACGHDGHTAVLLSVAEVLVSRRAQLAGRVLFVFQPAEEIVRGARAMLDDGALEGLTVDHVLGLHLSSSEPVGTVSVAEGPVMAATDSFRLLVRGRGGHAAYPHLCVDPIVAAAQLVTALQTLVSRETDPLDRSVVTITSVHAGTAYNIIPEEVELKGTLRTFDAGTRQRLRARLLEVAELTTRSLGCGLAHEWFEGTPAVVNDAAATERFRRVARELLGPENVREMTPIMGGDDMALWLEQAKGCYFFVGTRGGEETAFAHHHPRFDIDEAGLEVAVALFAAGVVDLLQAD